MAEPGPVLCGAKTRSGGTCRQVAGYGTDHVGFGRCRHHGGATPNGRTHAAKEAAAAEAARLGVPAEADPHEQLAYCLAVARRVADVLHQRADEDGLLDADGLPTPTLRAFMAAVDQLARHSKIAVDAGVEERRLQLDELVLERLAGALRAALAEVELTAEQHAQLSDAVRRHLAALDGEVSLRPRELTA